MSPEFELLFSSYGDPVNDLFGRTGYTFPSFDRPEVVVVSDETLAPLGRKGIKVSDVGKDNRILIDRDQPDLALSISFGNKTGCCVVVGKGKGFNGNINFRGDHSLVCFAGIGPQGRSNVKVSLDEPRTTAFFGVGTTFVSAHFLVQGENRRIVCGDDGMFSWDVFVRNYDSHTIFDIESQDRINDPGDIHIGPHVWLGQAAMILRPITIGGGSIIGARASVIDDIPSFSAAVGTPARVTRQGISWSRTSVASAATIKRVSEALKSDFGLNYSSGFR